MSVSTCSIYNPAIQLRWLERELIVNDGHTPQKVRILQYGMHELNTGRLDWFDVPTEVVPTEAPTQGGEHGN